MNVNMRLRIAIKVLSSPDRYRQSTLLMAVRAFDRALHSGRTKFAKLLPRQ